MPTSILGPPAGFRNAHARVRHLLESQGASACLTLGDILDTQALEDVALPIFLADALGT